jgi:hypothetical protein
VTLTSMNDIFKDMYPQAGTRIKQWVVDQRKEREWVVATCPTVRMSEHEDNTGMSCRNVGRPIWDDLAHDCCIVCNVAMDATSGRADVVAWHTERAKRLPACTDRSVLSDEIAPDVSLREHPVFKVMRKP